jgi:hypothetical protein
METVAGSVFSDAILARTAGSTYIISGANSGTADGYTFTSFENLHGAGGADSFAFSGTGILSGQINGGDGTDTLTYTAYTGPVTINLNTRTATGISGGFGGSRHSSVHQLQTNWSVKTATRISLHRLEQRNGFHI